MAEKSGTSVFDMDRLTVTQSRHSPFALSKVPGINQGAGSGLRIDTKFFLSDCPGTDVKLVHGQRWQTITGDMHEEIQGDWFGKVFGSVKQETLQDETVWVIGNATRMVIGNVFSTVVGTFTGAHVGAYIISFVAPMTEIHASTKNIVETHKFETEFFEAKIVWIFEWVGIPGLKIETVGAKVSLGGIKADVYALHAISEAIKTKLHLLEAAGAALEAKLGLKAKVQPTANAAPEVANLVP
jgi:hypothetical protein